MAQFHRALGPTDGGNWNIYIYTLAHISHFLKTILGNFGVGTGVRGKFPGTLALFEYWKSSLWESKSSLPQAPSKRDTQVGVEPKKMVKGWKGV